jgi:hypothetical protein
MLAVYRESEERLNAYFNSMEYQFQMDKYLLASNGGHSDGGDPLFSWEATIYFGLSWDYRFRFLTSGIGTEVSPLKLEWLTLHYDTDNGLYVIPYRSIGGEMNINYGFFQTGGTFDYFSTKGDYYAQISTFRIGSEPSRLVLYDYGLYLFGVGFNSQASFSSRRAFNYIINYNVDHIRKTGLRPYRGR